MCYMPYATIRVESFPEFQIGEERVEEREIYIYVYGKNKDK